MNIDKKQFLAALMAVGLGGATAACGGDAEATEETVEPDVTAGSEEMMEEAPAESDLGLDSMEEDQGMEEEDTGIAPTAE
jgi:ABC-type glycerol-3-phosphate transport system substrate-binding protein